MLKWTFQRSASTRTSFIEYKSSPFRDAFLSFELKLLQ